MIGLIASLLMLLVGPAASASGAAQVRFVHAVPGVGAAQLEAKTNKAVTKAGGVVAFGQVGAYADLPAGRATFRLPGAGSVKSTSERLRDNARYTVIALGGGTKTLRVLRDGQAKPGQARLRVVHAAPELGKVEIRLGDEKVATLLGFKSVAGYAQVDPGAYAVRVTRPGGGSTLAAKGGVPLTPGTSSTAFVVGSGGEPLQVAIASDLSAAPRGAPKTGLGGLAGDDDGPPIALALFAGLLAALLGAGGYVAVTGRSRGRGL